MSTRARLKSKALKRRLKTNLRESLDLVVELDKKKESSPKLKAKRKRLVKEIRGFIKSLSDAEAAVLLYDWSLWARRSQLMPKGSNWDSWLIFAGRGFGKTRAGAEAVRKVAERKLAGRIAVIGRTAADVRDTMVEGESGILAVCPPWNMPDYEPSKRRITWPNGVRATTFSAEEPDRLRGPQHGFGWGDEVASWRYEEALDNFRFGLRIGDKPRAVFTTTPLPTKRMKDMVEDKTTVVTTGSTFENRMNLSPRFFTTVLKRYRGTRLEQQEVFGKILEDRQGALWTRAVLDKCRISYEDFDPSSLYRIVVAVDPSAGGKSSKGVTESMVKSEKQAEAGIIVGGVDAEGHTAYIFEDATILGKPIEWGSRAVHRYHAHSADCIVAEKNQGGAMVELTIRAVDPNVSYKGVNASRGKIARAEPVSALYEQGRVKHVGFFAELETEMCEYEGRSGDPSPNRYDALVWCVTELLLTEEEPEPGMLLVR